MVGLPRRDEVYPAAVFYTYNLASRFSRVLYVGITSEIEARVWQHKTSAFGGFTSKYKVTQLVYFERFSDPESAIRREKQIKGWTRAKKIALIESENPKWKDLSSGWYKERVKEFRIRRGSPADRYTPPAS